jgi:hypothetical protein
LVAPQARSAPVPAVSRVVPAEEPQARVPAPGVPDGRGRIGWPDDDHARRWRRGRHDHRCRSDNRRRRPGRGQDVAACKHCRDCCHACCKSDGTLHLTSGVSPPRHGATNAAHVGSDRHRPGGLTGNDHRQRCADGRYNPLQLGDTQRPHGRLHAAAGTPSGQSPLRPVEHPAAESRLLIPDAAAIA